MFAAPLSTPFFEFKCKFPSPYLLLDSFSPSMKFQLFFFSFLAMFCDCLGYCFKIIFKEPARRLFPLLLSLHEIQKYSSDSVPLSTSSSYSSSPYSANNVQSSFNFLARIDIVPSSPERLLLHPTGLSSIPLRRVVRWLCGADYEHKAEDHKD